MKRPYLPPIQATRSRRARLAGLLLAFAAVLGVMTGTPEHAGSGVDMVYAGGEYPGTEPS
jgi:hypothetical protein